MISHVLWSMRVLGGRKATDRMERRHRKSNLCDIEPIAKGDNSAPNTRCRCFQPVCLIHAICGLGEVFRVLPALRTVLEQLQTLRKRNRHKHGDKLEQM